MTDDYLRGLADAAKICRAIAREQAPWRTIQCRTTNINRRERARAAIRCAMRIDKAKEALADADL